MSADPMTFGWHFYFLAKIVLFHTGHLYPEFAGDALLAALLILPKTAAGPWGTAWRRIRSPLALFLAAVLLWREALLPPFSEVFRFLTDSKVAPSADYLMNFLSGAVNPGLLAGLAALFAVCRAAQARSIRLTPIVLFGLAVTPVLKPSMLTGDKNLGRLENFYAQERGRKVPLPAAAADFDIVILHACSISWDDLKAAGLSDHPFLKNGFDWFFTRFNSGTSYSNPAALRLLRAPCGQVPHGLLFNSAPSSCFLFEQLRGLGYETWSASTHDGRYDDFAKVVESHGKAAPAMKVDDLPAAKLNFDESPIYSDLAVLNRWWKLRQASGAKLAALYFNTVSLHQGARRPESKRAGGKDRTALYAENAVALFKDLEEFFTVLRKSGRRTVVILAGEHGAALEGTKIQAPDLRAIPLPRITLVPAAVKIIGPGRTGGPTKILDRPASYLALAQALSNLLADASLLERPEALAPGTLPETALVSEAENGRVLQAEDKFFYKGSSGGWVELPPDSLGWLP